MEIAHYETVKWHLEALPHSAQKALDLLAKREWLRRSPWYLAGGTALTLQVGHRRSLDLDFFIPQPDFATGKLVQRFTKEAWTTDILREGTVYGRLLGAKVSFIAYPFFIPKAPYHFYGAVRVLDIRDIAVMKIIAISQRGKKRDFMDLYWYCKNQESLEDILRRVPGQYPTVEHNYQHILKSLIYFEDADNDESPVLYFKANWRTIKIFFQEEVRRLAKKLR